MNKILIFVSSIFVFFSAYSVQAVDITIARFFGDCDDAGSDTTTTTGEACIIQSIINAFNDANPDINVTTEVLDWGMTYEILQTRYGDKNPPDLHIMHRHRIPQFASIGAIADLKGEIAGYGMDPNDIVPAMMDALTWEGGMWGVPLDIHANLMHTNMDLMSAAGLVSGGIPVYPSSADELLDHARKCNAATGKDYISFQMADGFLGIRALYALVWQQNSNLFEGNKPSVDTPEVRNAINLFKTMVDEGLINPGYTYGDAQKNWMDGNACILINGTWVVDYYDANVDFNYYVGSFPTIFDIGATWADSHMWSLPANLKSRDSAKYDAAMKLTKFIWDHSIDWSRTGHMSFRKSVIDSAEYKNLPHRSEYSETASIMADTPHAIKYGAIQDLVGNNLIAIMTGEKEIDATLKDVNNKMKKLLR